MLAKATIYMVCYIPGNKSNNYTVIYPMIFVLSYASGYIEDMVIFTTLEENYSTKYFLQC